MHKQTTFVITAAILLTAIASAALYTVKIANAQSNMSTAGGANMTKSMTGPAGNMTKNMTSSAGNMTKSMTASAGNMTKTK